MDYFSALLAYFGWRTRNLLLSYRTYYTYMNRFWEMLYFENGWLHTM